MSRSGEGVLATIIVLLFIVYGALLGSYWTDVTIPGIGDPITWSYLLLALITMSMMTFIVRYRTVSGGEDYEEEEEEEIEEEDHGTRTSHRKTEDREVRPLDPGDIRFIAPDRTVKAEGRTLVTYPPKVPPGIFSDCKVPVGNDRLLRLRVFSGQLCHECPHKAVCKHRDYRTVVMDNPCLKYKDLDDTTKGY